MAVDDWNYGAPSPREPLDLEEVLALNQALDHFHERAVLPTLTPSQLLDERNESVEWFLHSPWAVRQAEGLLNCMGDRLDDLPLMFSDYDTDMWNEHCSRPLAGELFYVTDDMARMAQYASQSLPEELKLTSSLMPSQSGLFRLEQPRYVLDVRGQKLGCVAIGWRPALGNIIDDNGRAVSGRKAMPGLTFVMYTHRDDWVDQINADPIFKDLRAEGGVPPLGWLHTAFVPYGSGFDRDTTGTAPFAAALALLCQQEVAVRERGSVQRQAFKRARRLNLPSEVTVVTLRRVKHQDTATQTGGGREYSCRWFRRGHWRRHFTTDENGERIVTGCSYIPLSACLADREDLPWRVSTGKRVHRLAR